MSSPGGNDATSNRREPPASREAIDTLVALAQGNADKALVMRYIGELVAAGYVELEMRDNGEVEARLASGETYLLAETTILRLA